MKKKIEQVYQMTSSQAAAYGDLILEDINNPNKNI